MEKVIRFGKYNNIGILSQPDEANNVDKPLVLLLNAGMIHRVGPNNIYTKIARELIGHGYSTLRFDFTGIGDSPKRNDSLPFNECAIQEIREAIDYFEQSDSAKKIIVCGICSGADVGLQAACYDERIIGTILINGYFLKDNNLEKTISFAKSRSQLRYYKKSILDWHKWRKLLFGKTNIPKIIKTILDTVFGKDCLPKKENIAFDHWNEILKNKKKILIIYSEGSTGLDLFNMLFIRKKLQTSLKTGAIEIETIENTDHVFTLRWSQIRLVSLIINWLSKCV